jgi:hypothetical protein
MDDQGVSVGYQSEQLNFFAFLKVFQSITCLGTSIEMGSNGSDHIYQFLMIVIFEPVLKTTFKVCGKQPNQENLRSFAVNFYYFDIASKKRNKQCFFSKSLMNSKWPTAVVSSCCPIHDLLQKLHK